MQTQTPVMPSEELTAVNAEPKKTEQSLRQYLTTEQADGLVRAINVHRALRLLDPVDSSDRDKRIKGLTPLAKGISDDRLDAIVAGAKLRALALTASETASLVAELIARPRLSNPARDSNSSSRAKRNAGQENVLSAIDDMARSRPDEFSKALNEAGEGLMHGINPFKSNEFITFRGQEYADLSNGPATICTCLRDQQKAFLKEKPIYPCGLCPDCRGDNESKTRCRERQESAVLCREYFKRCEKCSNSFASLSKYDDALLAGLSDILLPLVSGITDFLHRRGGNRSSGLRQSGLLKPSASVINLSNMIAANLFYGTCVCDDDKERMRRENPCGAEHSLHGWNPTESSLLRHLFVATTHIYKEPAFALTLCPGELKPYTYTEVQLQQGEIRKGMAVRLVGPHLAPPTARNPPTRYQVYNVLRCQKCKGSVSLKNECDCTRDGSRKWPLSTKSPEAILDAEGARSGVFPHTQEPIHAFRVIPDDTGGDCVHTKKKGETSLADWEAPFLFPMGGKSCPYCGKDMKGRPAIAELPIGELLAMSKQTMDRTDPHQPEEEDVEPETEVFEGHLRAGRERGFQRAAGTDPEIAHEESVDSAPMRAAHSGEQTFQELDLDTLVPRLLRLIQEKWGRKIDQLNSFSEQTLIEWQRAQTEKSAPFLTSRFAEMIYSLSTSNQKSIIACIAELL